MSLMIVCSQPIKSTFSYWLERIYKPPWNYTMFPTVCQSDDLPCFSATTTYDTDSFPIRIDNHSSYCVTNNKDDFISGLIEMKANIQGIGGTVPVRQKGTVQWTWGSGFFQVICRREKRFLISFPTGLSNVAKKTKMAGSTRKTKTTHICGSIPKTRLS